MSYFLYIAERWHVAHASQCTGNICTFWNRKKTIIQKTVIQRMQFLYKFHPFVLLMNWNQ